MEPRPLLELNVQQAISSILQKPRWWIKSQDPEIRKKWMDEVELQLLLKAFGQSLVNWRHGQAPLEDLDETLQDSDSPGRTARLRKWLKGIVTKFGMDTESDEELSDFDSVEDEKEEEGVKEELEAHDATEEEKKLRALRQEVALQESYPTVKWTLNQLLLHERLSAIPVEEWTDETIASAVDAARSVEDPTLVPRAADFVLAVRRGVSVEEALPIPVGSDLLSADRVIKLKMHCEKIHRELSDIQVYVMKFLLLVAAIEDLSEETDPAKVVICPAGIDGGWISDNLIAEEVALKFKTEVKHLENVPDEEKDWHPRSNKQVLDLVHPSLFCCVYGQTLKTSSAPDPSAFTTVADQMYRLMFSGSELVERPANCNTAYQWIPSDFAVSEGGEAGQDDVSAVRILSYINNLHPEQFVDLYDSVGTIFGHFVPLFERMLSDRTAGMRPASFDVDTITHDSWRELPRRPVVPQEVNLSNAPVSVSLRGKKLQAIVKIAEAPQQRKLSGPGIYYFGCENIKDSRLAFRAEVEEPPYQQSDDDGVAEIYGLFNDELLVQVLGAVQTSVSRCVAFPNWLQHQVQPFELEDSSKPGVRKILAFFLVDPEKPIHSTSVIPPQQQKWVEPTLEAMVKKLHLIDVAERNIHSMMPRVMSLQEAKQHRLHLMDERAAAQEDGENAFGNSQYFSLCEH